MEERILKFSRKETLREASQAAGIGQKQPLTIERIISYRIKNLILVNLDSEQERRITHAKHKD